MPDPWLQYIPAPETTFARTHKLPTEQLQSFDHNTILKAIDGLLTQLRQLLVETRQHLSA